MMTHIQLVAFFISMVGILVLLDFRPSLFSAKRFFINSANKVSSIENLTQKKTLTAKEYVHRLNGTEKESLLHRSFREARENYATIGQSERYQRTLQFSFICSITAFLAGLLILKSILVAIVLSIGAYLIPMWTTQFALFRYERFLAGELEVALNLITTSYLRNPDILAAVEENIQHINEPVKASFINFSNTLKYINPNATAAIQQLKDSITHPLWKQWCDILITCQDNHLSTSALPAIVAKFSTLKEQQEANETRMMLPLKQATTMICMVAAFIPGMYLIYYDWYYYLITTAFGQFAMTVTVVAILFTINKAIRLSRPISFEV